MELIEQDVFANGIKLHIYRTGTNKPALVFAHGITDNGLCFLPIADKLADAFEIVLYDARGHGKSEAPETKTTLIDRANDLAGLVQALGLQKPNLLGHSLGALTVALCAGSYPDLPGRIILEDPPPLEILDPKRIPAPRTENPWRAVAAANKLKSIQELVELNRRESPTWPEAEREPWALSKQQVSLTIFDDSFIDAELGNQIIARIACPMLIVTADLDRGALYPPQAADKLAASLPAGRHVNLPGAGHNIRREQPVAYVAAVRSFLAAA